MHTRKKQDQNWTSTHTQANLTAAENHADTPATSRVVSPQIDTAEKHGHEMLKYVYVYTLIHVQQQGHVSFDAFSACCWGKPLSMR